MWGKKGPDNQHRADASKSLDACELATIAALQELATAGAPRLSKAHRAKALDRFQAAFDRARACLSDARYCFRRCEERLRGREKDGRAEPHDKAAVTELEPRVRHSSSRLHEVRRLAVAYLGGKFDRGKYQEEKRVSDRLQLSFFDRADTQRCHWCAKVEEYSGHRALDRDGYPVRREHAVRFCCYSCFHDGKDLVEPAPPALPPALPLPRQPEAEVVSCEPVVLPLLSEEGHHVD